ALDSSHDVGAQLPLTALDMEMMQALRGDGLGTADHSALACYYEKLAKDEVTSQLIKSTNSFCKPSRDPSRKREKPSCV
ncbi:hypothetical protein NVV43_31070, partial [Escherichia marmotae]|nr:hypothetical protein [Escherichia marmotae]